MSLSLSTRHETAGAPEPMNYPLFGLWALEHYGTIAEPTKPERTSAMRAANMAIARAMVAEQNTTPEFGLLIDQTEALMLTVPTHYPPGYDPDGAAGGTLELFAAKRAAEQAARDAELANGGQ